MGFVVLLTLLSAPAKDPKVSTRDSRLLPRAELLPRHAPSLLAPDTPKGCLQMPCFDGSGLHFLRQPS